MIDELIRQADALQHTLASHQPADDENGSEYWYQRYELGQLLFKIAEYYAAQMNYILAVSYFFKAYEANCHLGARHKLNISFHLRPSEDTIPETLPDLSGEQLFYHGLQAQAGLGRPVNYHLAMRYYQAALAKKYRTAYYAIGKLYHEWKKDSLKATEMYATGAKAGCAFAQLNVGYILEHEHQNTEQAIIHFLQAAEQGNAIAQSNCGICYFNDSDDRAIPWLLRAALQGHDDSRRLILDFIKQRGADKTPSNRDIILKLIRHYRHIISNYDSKLVINYLDELYCLEMIEPSVEEVKTYRIEACQYQMMFAVVMLKRCVELNPTNAEARYQAAVTYALHCNWRDYHKLHQLYAESPVTLIKSIISDTLFDKATQRKVLDTVLTGSCVVYDEQQQNEIAYLLGDYYHDQYRAWIGSFQCESDIPQEEARAKSDEALAQLMRVSRNSPFYYDAADLITLIRSMRGENYQELCFLFFTQYQIEHPVAAADKKVFGR